METRGIIYIARPSLFGQVRVKAGTTSMSAVMVNIWNFKPEMYLNYLEKFQNCCWWSTSIGSITARIVILML